MRFTLIAVVIAFLSATIADTSKAGDWEQFWSKFHLVKQRNNAWPQPFLHQDQQTYFNMINPMIDAGWQVECTLASQHFDPQTNKLNRVGVAQLRTILQSVPQDRQQVYVTAGQEQEVVQKRVEAVRTQLARWSIADRMQITTTNVAPSPLTGTYVDTTYQNFQSSLPAPSVNAVSVGDVDGGG